jgi:cell division protein FtsB
MWYIDRGMDNLFYRKEKKGFSGRELVARLVRSKKALLMLMVGLPVLFFLLFGNHGLVQRIRLHQQKAALEEKIIQAEADTKRLQAESKALDGDKRAIEKVAREKHGMVRDGETVYKVRKKD